MIPVICVTTDALIFPLACQHIPAGGGVGVACGRAELADLANHMMSRQIMGSIFRPKHVFVAQSGVFSSHANCWPPQRRSEGAWQTKTRPSRWIPRLRRVGTFRPGRETLDSVINMDRSL